MSSLKKKLQESEEYTEYVNDKYENVIDEESDTALYIRSDSKNPVCNFYFNVDDTPYNLVSRVETFEELEQFRRDAEDLMINIINKYETG